MERGFAALVILVLASGLTAQGVTPDGPPQSNSGSQSFIQHRQSAAFASDKLPVTTSSREARALYEAGIVSWENLQLDSALKRWRTAVNIEPDFALAHLMLAYCTPDPAEEKAERQKAEAFAGNVTPDERLLIAWFNGVRGEQLCCRNSSDE